jgi:two-component sensor histidine kinase
MTKQASRQAASRRLLLVHGAEAIGAWRDGFTLVAASAKRQARPHPAAVSNPGRFCACRWKTPPANHVEWSTTMELAVTESSLPEERLLIRELSHRINNEFASVASMLSLAAARAANDEAKSTLSAVLTRLEGYLRVHRALQMPQASDFIDASAYLRELCRSMSWSKLDSRNIELIFAERPLSLQSEQCWILGMIVYELINNAARHAFDEAGGKIRVQIAQLGRFVECHVSDTGTAPVLTRRGRGLKIIEELAARLHGRLEQQFGPHGSASRIIFPA